MKLKRSMVKRGVSNVKVRRWFSYKGRLAYALYWARKQHKNMKRLIQRGLMRASEFKRYSLKNL